ncbi:fungal chitosanase of glycosyl hydrolase group 75-domain-containing protein [Chaetomium tenue]|uniref:Fungal chitosanase of glycosyl hydrolase group 75-domain-containing protein n=1 Tax=Chaetomium tenue TaxID=1854479 RepID=A0ACB7PR21_9PEZI|nr:fungal chitosanase of glycosyl hydrolase group 75-domain-containing protein [Chaetomium globosum]
MVQLSAFLGVLALAISTVQAAPNLSSRQSIPDPSGDKNVGNGAGVQFIGGQCLGAADCASGCCATLPKGGQTIGVCSGVGAQNQAGKQGCGFESGGAGNQGGNQGGNQNNNGGGNQNNTGGNQNNGGGNQNNGQAGGTVQPSGLKPDPSGAGNVGNGQGKQFITGECTSDADCGSGCCALVNTGEANFGICSGPQANTQNGKQGTYMYDSLTASKPYMVADIMATGHRAISSFFSHILAVLLGVLAMISDARRAPENLLNFYDAVRAKGHCSNALATGFYSRDNGPNDFAYCGDHLATSGIIYLQGANGALANLDVDCDGTVGGPSDDGRCRRELSPDLQGATSFRDTLAGYGHGNATADLNPYVHPYVVFGNARGTRGRAGWRAFDPSAHGMRPLSVMAVVCPDRRLVYGVWGDTNGDDDEKPMVGEGSLALATACGGRGVTGGNGIDEDAVLFVGFTGDEAVPGPEGAAWDAADFDAFEKSIEGLGDRLVQRVRVAGAGGEDAACSVRPGWLGTAVVVAAVVGVCGLF